MNPKETPGPATVSVADAALILGISRASAYRMARLYVDSQGAEGIPAIRLGRRLVVPYARLQVLLTGDF